MLYLDASALAKLVLLEAESDALATAVHAEALFASSVVAAVELPRAVRRATDRSDALEKAERVLEATELVLLSDALIAQAARLPPPALRTLDAIHLASALSLAEELSGFIAYDGRLSQAARAAGLPVMAPA